ncbi:hypothetical protein EZV62_024791 [Acer yangbiense]|uniref:BHLH domain-containing protein n=1 Tax=Acer yangbiense TaxID=1000413 RepID=A0A5C7GXX6_9ROSI|nr:hypothetical protein EZV62_024791 [Acer yangbiense]
MGCCCSGGGGQCYEDANVKEDQEHLTALCIDAHLKHAIRTKACEALQYFPFSIAIYPWIHGEVAIENQPRWIINANALDSNHPHESNKPKLLSQFLRVLSSSLLLSMAGKEPYKSNNLFAESRKRNKLRDKLYTLRSLVHKTSKMDISTTVGNAIEYIGELHLQQELKKLNEELREIEEEECKENAELKSSKLEALVEVNQIGERDFLIKYICEQKWGGFARLMEAIHSLGLQTVEVNVTTSNGMVLNGLKVEVRLVAILSC